MFARAASSVADFFIRWWGEATRPIKRDYSMTPFRAILRRVMLWVPVAVLAAALLGGAGFYFFTGWRASDLAPKAVENARVGNLPMARLQTASALQRFAQNRVRNHRVDIVFVCWQLGRSRDEFILETRV